MFELTSEIIIIQKVIVSDVLDSKELTEAASINVFFPYDYSVLVSIKSKSFRLMIFFSLLLIIDYYYLIIRI